MIVTISVKLNHSNKTAEKSFQSNHVTDDQLWRNFIQAYKGAMRNQSAEEKRNNMKVIQNKNNAETNEEIETSNNTAKENNK